MIFFVKKVREKRIKTQLTAYNILRGKELIKMIEENKVYRKQDLAKALNVSVGTVSNLMKKGLPYKKINSLVFFTGGNVLEYFATATEEEENDKLKKWRANNG